MADSPKIETNQTPEYHEPPLRWPPDYNDMRIYASHALWNWARRKGFKIKSIEDSKGLNKTVHDETIEPRARDDAAAALNILAPRGWLAQLKYESPAFPKERKFPLESLTDQEVLFLWVNLKGYIAHDRFAQLAQQTIARRTMLVKSKAARQRAAQISMIEEMDPRVPENLVAKLSFRVTGARR